MPIQRGRERNPLAFDTRTRRSEGEIRAVGTALLLPDHRSGNAFYPQGWEVGASTAVSADTLYANAITIPADGYYDALYFLCTSATGNVRMGIYEDFEGLPGALVVDGGTKAVASPATTLTITAEPLTGARKYWLAAVFDGAPSIREGDGSGIALGVERSFTYAALPDPYGTPTVFNYQTHHLIAVRKE